MNKKSLQIFWMAICLLMLWNVSAWAQTIPISGKVTDISGDGLPGVNVILRGTTKGVITDTDGNYKLDVPDANSVLVFSFVGFDTQEMAVGAQKTIDVTLLESTKYIDEVVVVGYSAQRRESLTGALATVDSKTLMDVTSPSAANLLAGKVTGVYSSTSSGRPGTKSDIVIRGKSTINGSVAPLWVIDGVIYGNSQQINESGTMTNNTVPELNPNDIETITVLKDAASTAIYGSSGSNGVIVVTTKRAKSGMSGVNFSARFGLNQIHQGNFALMNGSELYDLYNSFPDKGDLNLTPDLKDQDFDWFDNGTKTGATQDYNLSFTGSGDKFKTYVSLGYYDEKGAVKGYEFDRFSGRFNMDYKLTDFITLKPSISASRTSVDNREHDLGAMYRRLPWDSPYSSVDGHILSNDEVKSEWYNSTATNYLYNLQWNYSESTTYDLIGGFDFDIRITDWLTFASTNNYAYNTYSYMSYVDARSSGGLSDNGSLTNTRSDYYRRFTNQMLRFNKSFEKHSVSAILAYEFNDYYYSMNSSTKASMMPGLTVQDGGSVPKAVKGNSNSWAVQSFLFNGNYSYDNRYLAQLSFRRDGASNFGTNKQYGNFFSISGGWNIHNEAFYDSLADVINQMKLRASFGSTGNRPNSLYPQYGLYKVSTSYNEIPGAIINQLPNSDLTWEKTYTTGVGIDLRFLDRIGLTFDFYNKNTSDLLQAVPISALYGVTSIWRNVGCVNNKGFEVAVTADIIRTQDFYWSVDANIGYNKNKVTELYGGKDIIIGSGSTIAGSGQKLLREGLDADSWYLREWAGVDPATGAPMWYATAADGSRTIVFNRNQANQVVVGSAAPKLVGGFGTSLEYKGITLSAAFNFVTGSKLYNYMRTEFDSDGAYTDRNQMRLADGWSRWQSPGDIATHPQAIANGNKNAQAESSRFLEPGGFLRMRNLTLGYEVPRSLTKVIGVRVYASGENLFTITDYSGIDPEVGLNNVAVDSYPMLRKFMFGLNLTF